MLHPNPDMLIYIAVGDAYGIAYEFLPRRVDVDMLDLGSYSSHPTYGLDPGTYTDDTQMSIAVAEALISGEDLLDPVTWADAFVAAYQRDPRDGYSRGLQAIISGCRTGADLLAAVDGRSDKNGAAMRAVPLGVIPDVSELLAVSDAQAAVTHDSPGGLLAARAVALMSHFYLYRAEPLAMLQGFLEDCDPAMVALQEPWRGRVAGPDLGVKTARAISTLLRECKSLGEVLRTAVEWGGDVDTVAAVAIGIASSSMVDDLPARLIDDLEPGGSYGPTFLRGLGAELMSV